MSRGIINDKFMIKIRQHEFIVDNKTGEPMPDRLKDVEYWISIPKQISNDQSLEDIQVMVNKASHGSYGFLLG